MCFQHADVVADIFGQPQKCRAGVYIGRKTEIRSLDRDEMEKITGERRGVREVGTDGIRGGGS